MKLFGLSEEEVHEALIAASSQGEEGGLMTTSDAVDLFWVFKTRRFLQIWLIDVF